MNIGFRKQPNRKMDGFSKILIFSVVIATAISLVFYLCSVSIFTLNENQLLYLFSSMAQVIGGAFGLTLTAYVFFVDKFQESTEDDETLYDATKAILKRYFYILISLAVISGAIVFLCIAGIIDIHNWMLVYPLIINESVSLFLIGLSAILTFGVMLLDPQKLDKEIEKMKKNAEEYYQASGKLKSGDFREFLKTYNLLENTIIDFAKEFVKNQISYARNYRNYKPLIIQSLKVLAFNEVVPPPLQNELHELRMYRNGLVHGVDFDVTQDICDRISTIYNTLQHAYDVFKQYGQDSAEYVKAIEQVHNLVQ